MEEYRKYEELQAKQKELFTKGNDSKEKQLHQVTLVEAINYGILMIHVHN